MEINFNVLQIEFEFRYAPSIFCEITGLGLSTVQRSNSFRDFFSKRLQILTWILAFKSITMFYRLSLSFDMLHCFLVKLLALKLSKFQQSISFPDFFPKPLQILTWFWTCKSITMTYRSSLSFVTIHWFLAKSWSLDLVNFSDQTVFCSFFLNACRYWADFWHVSKSSLLTHWVGVSLHLIDFSWN